MHHVIVLLWFPEIIFFVGLPVRLSDRIFTDSGCPSRILSLTGLPSRSFDFLNIDKMLRCAIAIKLNGETLRQVRTLYTHNADSHLKITQSVYFTH